MQNLKVPHCSSSMCILLDDFDECKIEHPIRVEQLMYTVCYSITHILQQSV